MKGMGVFSDGEEVIVCNLDDDGQPVTGDYFTEGNGRDREEYNYGIVNGPIKIEQSGRLEVDHEGVVAGSM